MIHLPSLTQLDHATATRIWSCTGPTDMRRGFDRLAEQAQQVTQQHPQSGHLFVFRSRRGDRAATRVNVVVRVAFPFSQQGRHPERVIPELNSRPACSPVNASPAPLPTHTHDSGPWRHATPSTYGASIRCSMPV